MKEFAAGVLDLQERRHGADYDPSVRLGRSDAVLAVETARAALSRLQKADKESRDIFLTLLIFPPRQ
jgi:hypothetical protein